jgi:hypothetical protein
MKKATDYRSFLDNKEITYPGIISKPMIFPGDGRIRLAWNPSPDPSVTKYVIYWNNYADSIIVPANSHNPSDTVQCLIDNLKEYNYTLYLFSFDKEGNKSVPTEITNARVFGSIYQGSLLNRPIVNVDYADDSLIINWGIPDTINISTTVEYVNVLNQTESIKLRPDENRLAIGNWNLHSTIYYQSIYKPTSNAVDSFMVLSKDSVDVSNIRSPVDKSLWKEAYVSGDVSTNAFGAAMHWIWDDKPGGYPEVYHTDGSVLPHTFTFDLGREYPQLTQFAEWGRTDCSCTNPSDFEVWGIVDTTGAATQLPATDDGWKAESIAKGWVLLTEVKRNDDGIAGIKVDLINNAPPVRYIRIRVLHTTNDATKYSHMSEVSFWRNPL